MKPNLPAKGRPPTAELPPELAEPPSPPRDLQAALRGMVDRPFLATRRYQEQQERAWREGAHPDILEFERCFIKRMKRHGIPMFASEVIRDGTRQDELYALGRSKAKAGQSPHGDGCAVDLVHSVLGWELHPDQWRLVGHIGKELAVQKGVKLVWGGDWSFYDPAHWEIADWKSQRDQYPFPRVLKWTANWKKLHDAAVEAARAAHRE